MGEFVTTVTPEVFDHTFNINVKAVLFAVHKALRSSVTAGRFF